MIRIGTSGFSYDDWLGPVYPAGLPARDQLAFYAREFSTVELNVTYYRVPDARTVAGMGQENSRRLPVRREGLPGVDARAHNAGFRRVCVRPSAA